MIVPIDNYAFERVQDALVARSSTLLKLSFTISEQPSSRRFGKHLLAYFEGRSRTPAAVLVKFER